MKKYGRGRNLHLVNITSILREEWNYTDLFHFIKTKEKEIFPLYVSRGEMVVNAQFDLAKAVNQAKLENKDQDPNFF
jgi:hypothetical protein